jgi:hypothetical protein
LSQDLNLNSIVQRGPDVIAAEADTDLVMVDIRSGYYYGISDVARYIWESIEQPRKIADVIDNLMDAYDVDRNSCEEETLSFLNDLLSQGLVKVNNGASS